MIIICSQLKLINNHHTLIVKVHCWRVRAVLSCLVFLWWKGRPSTESDSTGDVRLTRTCSRMRPDSRTHMDLN